MNKKRLLLIMTMAVMPAGLTRAGVDSPYNGTSGYTTPKASGGQWLMTEYDDHSGMSQRHITKILQDRNGYMWFASWNGLNRYDGYEFAVFKSHPGDGTSVVSDRIRNIVMGKDGDIFCFIDQQVWRFSTDNYAFGKASARDSSHYCKLLTNDPSAGKEKDTVVCGFHIEKVRQVFDDRQGNKWVMGRYGVKKLSRQKPPFDTIEAVPNDVVRCLFADRKGRIWIASRNTATVTVVDARLGLKGYLGSDGHLHDKPQHFAPVYAMMQQSDGTLWMCSKPQGLIRMKENADGTFDISHITKGNSRDISLGRSLNSNDIYDIKEDAHGRLWVATLGGGINMMERSGGKTKIYNKDNAYAGYPAEALNVRKLMIAGDSMLMATTTGGLLAADIRTPKTLFTLHRREANRSNSLSCNATMDMVIDGRGRLFVSTESGGINMLEGDLKARRYDFRHFTAAQGLASDVVMAMSDMGGKLMVQSMSQLIRLDADEGRADNYGGRFFATPIRFSDAQPLRLADGRWLLSLETGVMVMAETALDDMAYTPQIAVTSVEVAGAPRNYAAGQRDTIWLGPNQRDVTIGFAALDFTDNENIRYSTRLTEEGEGEWTQYNHARTVSLLNLTPGTYRLDIRSTNADGLAVDNIKSIYMVVEPAVWENTWAKCIYLLLLAGVIFAVTYTLFYIRTLKRQRKENYDKYMSLINGDNDDNHERLGDMSDDDHQFMKRFTAFIADNLSNSDASIDDMASATATSRSSLNRKTKNLLGMTPADFLKEARMKKACQLLMTTSGSINDIAYACGFSDAKYFSKCFKASRGVSPSEYRSSGKR